MRRLTLAGWIVAAYGMLALGQLRLSDSPAGHTWALLLAPAGAAVLCLAAVRSLPPSSAGPWSLVALAAWAAVVGGVLRLTTPSTAAELFPAVAAALSLLAAGLAWTIHQRDRHRQAEIALDVLLIIGAVFVVLLRWAPGVRGMVDGTVAPLALRLDTVVGPLAGLCAIAFAGVLVVSLRGSRAHGPAAAIAGASVLLAIASLPLALDVPTTAPYQVAGVVGWGFLAYAAQRVLSGGAASFAPADSDPGGARLRQAVAPLAALLLAVVIVDGGTRDPLTPAAALVAGLVAAGVALRVSHLLEATKDRQSERRQLDQSRALVEVSRALAGTTDLGDTLRRVAESSTQLLNGRGTVIELLSDDGRSLEVRAAVGFSPEFLGLRFPVEGSFTGWVVRNGVARTTADVSMEPDIPAKSRRFLPRCAVASAPLRFHERILGVLSALTDEPFDRHDMELLGAFADQAAVAIENARLFEEVNRLSLTDPLTNLANRRRLEEELGREFSAAVRGRRLVAVMFDLNDFKEYNDRFGHIAGDEALQLFGQALKAETRTMNLAARYGGDEFVALLGDSTLDGARVFAQRVKRRFMRSVARLGRRPIGVAVGIASYARAMNTPEQLIAAADAELYEMKARRTRAG